MADLQAIAREAILVVSHIEASRYTTVAGFTLLVYDHALTFADEMRLIWPARTSTVKVLFLINRYITPAFQAFIAYEMSRLAVFSDKFCQRFVLTYSCVEVGSLALSNYILLLRVHALWGRGRNVMIGLLVIYVLTYAAVLTTATIALVTLLPTVFYSPVARVCAVHGSSDILSSVWIAPIFFEVITFVMTAIKCVEHAKTEEIKIPILKSLYRDQFLYFLVIIIIRIFNLLVWLAMPPSLAFLGVFFIWSTVIAFVSRMLLNLKDVASAQSWENETRMVNNPNPNPNPHPHPHPKHVAHSGLPIYPPLYPPSAPSRIASGASPDDDAANSSIGHNAIPPRTSTASRLSKKLSQHFRGGSNASSGVNFDMISNDHHTVDHSGTALERGIQSRGETPSSTLSASSESKKNSLFAWGRSRKSRSTSMGTFERNDRTVSGLEWNSYEEFVELDEVHTMPESRRSQGSQWPPTPTPTPTQVSFDTPDPPKQSHVVFSGGSFVV